MTPTHVERAYLRYCARQWERCAEQVSGFPKTVGYTGSLRLTREGVGRVPAMTIQLYRSTPPLPQKMPQIITRLRQLAATCRKYATCGGEG